jgi:putative sigma-54 modulation protein
MEAGMQLSITFRHMDASDSIREYAQERVERVNKYIDRAGEAHVVLSLERHLHNAEIQIQSGSWVLRGREKSEDMHASIDGAMEKIERQLTRQKEKIKNHHSHRYAHHQQHAVDHPRVRHNGVSVARVQEAPLSEDVNGISRVVKTNEFLAQSMAVEEAIVQLDLMNAEFYVFTNASTREMNVVYRRKDGHYGLIEAGAAR